MRRQVLTATIAAIAVVPLSAGPAGAAPKTVKPPTPASEAKALVKSTKALKRSTPRRARLIVLAGRIQVQQAKQPCTALKTLKLYRGSLRTLPRSARKRALSVDARALALSQRLLRSKRTKACGGAIKPATVTEATPSVRRNDASGMDLTVNLPEVSVGSIDKGGKLWTQLGAPKAESAAAPGQPAIPVASFSLAVPEGATLETVATPGDSYTLADVDVLPAQPEPVDADTPAPNFFQGAFVDGKFVPPGEAYRRTFPAKPADAAVVGSSRGLKIATLQVPLASYDGKKRRLQIRRSVNVAINFKGGERFGGEGSAWDKFGLSLSSGVLNAAVIQEQWRKFPYTPQACGEEFLIITNPSMRASADKLAVARNAAGIKTRVFDTVAGQAGVTNNEIRDFIRGRATRPFCVRPGYVLLLGNDESVPTFEISGATSDLPYATTDDADTLPDLAQGRIPGTTIEVDTAIDKIIAYGNNPLPGAAGTNALMAAQFQDDDGDGRENRTFIQFAETISKGLEARGVAVARVYGEEPHGNPTTFNDGTALPASLTKPGFAWDGDGADVSASWNAGTFLGIHRDHGWSDGWGTPSFTTASVEALTNTALPVLMSINCSSGAYDRDDSSFATRALGRAGGGAVAVFGDTEDSPSTHNSIQGLGFVDALLPSILPAEGPAAKQRLGDALVHGKLRLNSLKPAPADGNTTFEHRIWHLFGDPTMRMRGGGGKLTIDPSIFNIRYERVFRLGPPPEEKVPNYQVIVTGLAGLEGQTVALRKGDEVVGQGLVQGGATAIKAIFGDGSVRPGELSVVIDAATDDKPIVVPVPSDKAPSALSQTCPTSVLFANPMTVTGTLLSAPEGSEVTVTFTYTADLQGAAPDPAKTVVQTVKTDASGNYTASYPTIRQDQGKWTVTSAFAGDAAYLPSSTAPCSVTVVGSVAPTTPGTVG